MVSITDGPYFVSSTLSSTQGNLKVSEIATYIAFFTIDAQAFASGSVINTVSATASSPGQTNDVTDVGDDPNTAAANDPTVVNVNATASLNVVKTFTVYDGVADGIVGAGDTINYTITVENNGTSVITSMTLVDTIANANGVALSLTSGPTFSAQSQGSAQGTLNVGETETYVASYLIQSAAALTGKISNTVVATASDTQGNLVSDRSDNGDDTDGNTLDDLSLIHI